MLNWIDPNELRPSHEQKCWILTKDSETIEVVYSSWYGWFIDLDKREQLQGRVYGHDDITGWMANG